MASSYPSSHLARTMCLHLPLRNTSPLLWSRTSTTSLAYPGWHTYLDEWLLLGQPLTPQDIIHHILHLRYSINMQKPILKLTPALDSTSKCPMYHYSHQILHPGYEIIAVPVNSYPGKMYWVQLFHHKYIIWKFWWQHLLTCTVLMPHQQGLQLWTSGYTSLPLPSLNWQSHSSD
jgi:hypothetical protein